MLVALRIKNLALVEDLSLEFSKGFNIITGETGAGKSILIGALSLVLGERADRNWIRTGSDACTVEAVFEVAQLESLSACLETLALEPCQDGQLLLKRVFSVAGTNRQFVNGSPATLLALKQIGELLVDMHGPHDHQSLLKSEVQLRILDRFAGLDKERLEFSALMRELRQIEAEKASLVIDEKTLAQQVELLEYQLNEIEAAKFTPYEEERLESDYTVASNAQKLLDLVGRAQDALSEGEAAALNALAQAQRALRDLATLDPKARTFEESGETLVNQLQELTRELSRYISHIDVDPDRVQYLSERMTLVQSLKRKYGGSLESVLAHADESRLKLEQLKGREALLAKLEAKSAKVLSSMEKLGKTLRAARNKAIPKLSKSVSVHLKELGFGRSSYDIQLAPIEASAFGMDEAQFRFAPNAGEPAQPLREIASSGEMARVMLALKTALAAQDEVPVLVFDEVDANVGGQIGNAVGEKMAEIGRSHQVLCITHLPQVAVHGRTHQVVFKDVQKGRTFTRIEPLEGAKRIDEIARMLGGKGATAQQHAKEMLQGVR